MIEIQALLFILQRLEADLNLKYHIAARRWVFSSERLKKGKFDSDSGTDLASWCLGMTFLYPEESCFRIDHRHNIDFHVY